MDLFKNLFQPTIVHIGENAEYSISNKYCLNYNIVQIDWFQNNSIVLEDGSGIVLLETADITNPFSASVNDAMFLLDDGEIKNNRTVLDIPRIFFPITSKFNNDGVISTPATINAFIISLLQLSDITDKTALINLVINGHVYNDGNIVTNDDLVPGKDFYINETFATYLIEYCLDVVDESLVDPDTELGKQVNAIRNIALPNYLKNDSSINTPWVELTEEEQSNTDLEHYMIINKFEDYGIDTDALGEFYITFTQTILDANTDKPIITSKDALYKAVLQYFANGQTDETVTKLNLVLGASYTGQMINTASSYCNCKSSSNSSSIESCASLYSDAMIEHLKIMLGDAEFYCSWMFNESEVNTELISFLKYLIIKLKEAGFTLTDTNSPYNCSCPSLNNVADEKSYKLLDNYLKVLDFVMQCNIKQNINKIKLWGSQFGELLPKLYFA